MANPETENNLEDLAVQPEAELVNTISGQTSPQEYEMGHNQAKRIARAQIAIESARSEPLPGATKIMAQPPRDFLRR